MADGTYKLKEWPSPRDLSALPRHHPAAIFLDKLRQRPLNPGIKGQTRW